VGDNPRLKSILDRIDHLAPVIFMVPVQGTLAVHLSSYALENHITPETVIAEALRAYLGDA
jgi:hypothetical protein